jgi:hypothetical protein
MTTMTQNSADSVAQLTPLEVMPTAIAPLDVMTDTPILFSFIDYLCARRGINRHAAVELISNYMLARATAHAEAHNPTTAREPQCTKPPITTHC